MLEPHLAAVMIASGYGSTEASIDVYDLLKTKGPDTITPSLAGKEFPEQPNSRTIAALQMPGAFPLTLAAACASGSQSIAMAVDKLKEGYQLAMAGGVETVADEKEDLVIGSFTAFRALSKGNENPGTSSRPFDAKRDGFVTGSGIGLLLLATASLTEKLGVEPYARIERRMVSNDASLNITRANPEAQAKELTRMMLVNDGNIFVPDIIWAHTTSTGLGDRTEISVYKKVFGNLISKQSDGRNEPVLIYAPKSVLGHRLGASGGNAAVTAVLAMRDKIIPYMPTLDNPQAYTDAENENSRFKPDPDIPGDLFKDINFVRQHSVRLKNTPSIMVGNQGFGSHNAYFVLEPV